MGTRNNAFVDTKKEFGGSSSDHYCDVGLGLGMKQVEESYPNRSFMPMPHHHQLSPYSCCGEGFDGGACDGDGTIVCNTSNQVACTGDIYDVVVGAASASVSVSAATVVLKSLSRHHRQPFNADPTFPHNSSGEMAAPGNARVPFTAAQWQELERQTMIYKYMMASVPVPPDLLIPLTRTSSDVIKGSLELGFSSSSSDPEPWRCRRTDGKKWRCSRDVAPDQKYCERHTHKSRPRSRKPVELPNHSIINNNNDHKSQTLDMASDGYEHRHYHQNSYFINHKNAHFDQPRWDWFMKGETTVPFASNSILDEGNVSSYQQHYKDHRLILQAQHLNEQFSPGLATFGGSSNLHQTHSQETRSFIDAWSIAAERDVAEMDGIGSKCHVSSNEKLPLSSLKLSMSGWNDNNQEEDDENSHQMGAFGGILGLAPENVRALIPPPQMTDATSWMGSPPGGPLAEALCLGIASSQSKSTSSCSKST